MIDSTRIRISNWRIQLHKVKEIRVWTCSSSKRFWRWAEERSFSRAAARLHRTQPAVSQAIAKLEGELGEVLFERSSRDGTLTDAGEVLREYAAKLLNLRTEAEGALSEFA